MLFRRKTKRVYLDYAAATPLLPEAKAAMEPYYSDHYANPSAIHSEGIAARAAIAAAREKTARTFVVRPEFVTFLSGGTESNNLAVMGSVMSQIQNGKAFSDMEVITTQIEHPSVLETMKSLERCGVLVKYVGVNEKGLVNLEQLHQLVTEKTVLFSVAYANSEIGSIQRVHSIKKILSEAEKRFGSTILFHLDAAQAPLWLNCQFDSLKIDLLSLDAGKCHGPKGVGVLIRSRRARIVPYLYGGGQEDGLRPGTENVTGIVGAAVAFYDAQAKYKERAKTTANVRDAALRHIQEELPQAILNGAIGEQRLANNINISIPGLDTEFATVVLDKHGFAVSTKSACAGAGGGESIVVKEISGDSARASSTLRISLSPQTSLLDIKHLVTTLSLHIQKMKPVTFDSG